MMQHEAQAQVRQGVVSTPVRLWRGVDVPPWLTRAFRWAVEAAVMGGLAAVYLFVDQELPTVVTDLPTEVKAIILFTIAQGMEMADQIDPAKRRFPL